MTINSNLPATAAALANGQFMNLYTSSTPSAANVAGQGVSS